MISIDTELEDLGVGDTLIIQVFSGPSKGLNTYRVEYGEEHRIGVHEDKLREKRVYTKIRWFYKASKNAYKWDAKILGKLSFKGSLYFPSDMTRAYMAGADKKTWTETSMTGSTAMLLPNAAVWLKKYNSEKET